MHETMSPLINLSSTTTASYRDPEAAATVARSFARAAHPERIFFGIHAQV
jgi:hypothetical protein